jgi:peptidoglycan-N-acetylglucosamine deacetylase
MAIVASWRSTSIVLAVPMLWASHGAPVITANARLRRRYFPSLCGLGPTTQVALTFDDGPDPTSTPLFLEALERLGWKATFFVLGDMVRCAPDLTRRIVASGHEVALHGDRHRSHVLRTPWSVAADMRRAHDIVTDVTGEPIRWFRPPYGSISTASLTTAHALGMRTVLWSAWGRDWTARASPASVAAEISRDLAPGGTILLHDSDCTSAPGAWRSALGALDLLAASIATMPVVALRDHLS